MSRLKPTSPPVNSSTPPTVRLAAIPSDRGTFDSAQRNTYLTGFTLFLSLVLTRTFYIVLDLIHAQEEYAKLKASTATQSRDGIAAGDAQKRIAELEKKLKESEAKDRDFGTLGRVPKWNLYLPYLVTCRDAQEAGRPTGCGVRPSGDQVQRRDGPGR